MTASKPPGATVPATDIARVLGFASPAYAAALARHAPAELAPDLVLYDLAEASRDNRDLRADHSFLQGRFWKIGQSGQGDGWLLGRDGQVHWFDHNHGDIAEGSLVGMGLDLDQWIELAVVIKQYERRLDADEALFDDAARREEFRRALDAISPTLFDLYPYGYF
jgi:hypothetical protein